MKVPGEEQWRNGPASASRDTLVTELAKAESDLERIDAQRTAANARIDALRKDLAAHEAPLGSVVVRLASTLHQNYMNGSSLFYY